MFKVKCSELFWDSFNVKKRLVKNETKTNITFLKENYYPTYSLTVKKHVRLCCLPTLLENCRHGKEISMLNLFTIIYY